jgi:hypothetical protein
MTYFPESEMMMMKRTFTTWKNQLNGDLLLKSGSH